MPYNNCWRTAPTACSEASTISEVGALEHGYTSITALASAALVSWKVDIMGSLNSRVFGVLGLPAKAE